MADKDYAADWLAYWQSFCRYLRAEGSTLSCIPEPKRAFNVRSGTDYQITVRCAITRGYIAAELTLRGPRKSANFDRIEANYRGAHGKLSWNKAVGRTEGHILGELHCDPRDACNRTSQHAWMKEQIEQFAAWVREFSLS